MIQYHALSLGLSIAALLLCVSDLIFTLMDKRTGKPQNRVYIAIMLLLSLNAGCGMATLLTEGIRPEAELARSILEISRYIYFLTHTLLAPAFFYYISFVVGRSYNWGINFRNRKSMLSFVTQVLPDISVLVMEVIILLNPFLHWTWYYDENLVFHRAWGEFLIYIQAALWIVASFILTMRSWNILSKNRKNSILFCYCLAVLGLVVQLFDARIYAEVLMEAIGFTGVLMYVENEDDRRDVELDVYNRAAFVLDISSALKNKLSMQVLIVRDIHFERTENPVLLGKVDSSALGFQVAEYLGTKIPKYYIYALGHGIFALVLYDQPEESVRTIAQDIAKRFEQPWTVDGEDIYLTASVLIVDVPERAHDADDLLYIAECPIPETAVKPVMEGEDLGWIIRHAAVEEAVTRGLSEGSFEVYYQPTYHTDCSLYGAEALLRMKDRKLGTIYPDEFIPVSEQLGLIDEIDEFVLEQVCGLLATGVPQKQGVGHINVNLSVLECMKEGFADHIIEIVEGYGIKKHHISFEITESVAATDYRHLEEVIEKLKSAGFMFYIDDFGTGYSNISALFSLGADVIKIDKSVLWGAQTDPLGMVLLEGTMRMVKEMHKKTLAEGVETEEQIALLKRLGCDYLQGYYFSKPVSRSEFLEVIGAKATE